MSAALHLGATRSSFAGAKLAFKSALPNQRTVRVVPLVEASRICDLTGKRANKANSVSFSNRKTRKWQYPNLQEHQLWWEEGKRWVTVKLCAKALKTVQRRGLASMAAEAGIDLKALPFKDGRPERLQYLAETGKRVPVGKNPRAMKNAVRLQNSKKTSKVPIYDESGRILYVAASTLEEAMVKKSQSEQATQAAAERPELKITISE